MSKKMELACAVGDVIRSPRFAEGRLERGYVLAGKSGDADDPVRATSFFVVTDVARHDTDVMARILKADGSYDPTGVLIGFFQRKMRHGPMIRPQEIECVGQMRQSFIWVARPPVEIIPETQEWT